MGLELMEDEEVAMQRALVRAQLEATQAQAELFREQVAAARAQTAAYQAEEALARQRIARTVSEEELHKTLLTDAVSLVYKLGEIADFVSVIASIRMKVERSTWTSNDPSVQEGHSMLPDPEIEKRLKALKTAELEVGEEKMKQLASRLRQQTLREEAETQVRIKRKQDEDARRAPRDRRSFGGRQQQGQKGPTPVETTGSTQVTPQNPQGSA